MGWVPCQVCGRKFLRSSPRRYCGPACRGSRYKPRPQRCVACRVRFTPLGGRGGARFFCSEACAHPKSTCAWCAKVFTTPFAHARRDIRATCCSMACKVARQRGGFPSALLRGKCVRCGRAFVMKPSNVRRGIINKHCSTRCRTYRVTLTCVNCGAGFERKRMARETARFCSVACYRRNRGETSLEAVVRRQLEEAGIPFLQEARIGRWSVDFLVLNLVVIEADGAYWHGDPRTKARDKRRDRAMAKRGYVVLRCGEEVVRADPSMVTRNLRALLRARGAACRPTQRSSASSCRAARPQPMTCR